VLIKDPAVWDLAQFTITPSQNFKLESFKQPIEVYRIGEDCLQDKPSNELNEVEKQKKKKSQP